MENRVAQRWGAVLIGLGVVAGAFGAHALKARVDPGMLAVFEKAVFYQLIHGLALLSFSTLALSARSKTLLVRLLVLGVVIFSGSLYLYVLSGAKGWAIITPVGGTLLILTWGLVFYRIGRLDESS